MRSDIADILLTLHAHGVLILAAERGTITRLMCAIPHCVCPEGREHFEYKKGRNFWAPSPDHFPIPARDGGPLTPDNVRLAHWRCNNLEGISAGKENRDLYNNSERGKAASAKTGVQLSIWHSSDDGIKVKADLINRLRSSKGREAAASKGREGACKRWRISLGLPCADWCGNHE
jgi:hypothetical protein